MPVWGAAVLAAVLLIGGFLCRRVWKKTGKRPFMFAGIALFLLCAGCVFYLAAALLLLGSAGRM